MRRYQPGGGGQGTAFNQEGVLCGRMPVNQPDETVQSRVPVATELAVDAGITRENGANEAQRGYRVVNVRYR